MAAAAPLHAGRGDGGVRRGRGETDPMRGMIAVPGMAPVRARQTAPSTASIPNARLRRRGQVPKPLSGAPQAQHLTPVAHNAAQLSVSFTCDPKHERTKSTAAGRFRAACHDTGISTSLTD